MKKKLMDWVIVNYTVVGKNETFDVCESEEKNKKKKTFNFFKHVFPVLSFIFTISKYL